MTPGVGEIPPQFLKILDDVGLSGLTCLWVGLGVWVPLDLKTRLLTPLFK